MQIPTFHDVLLAQRQVQIYLARTPLHGYTALEVLLGKLTFVKHENYQPVGAFKVRGVNIVSQLSADEREHGMVAASTGNHGQSVAYAVHLFGVPVRIVVSENANPGKVAAMQGMGAEVIFHGPTFDEARAHCEQLAREHSYRYIHSGAEPLLIAGVATETLEMLEDEPRLDVIIVPTGGGSGAAGACIAAKAVNPRIRVIGVQVETTRSPTRSRRSTSKRRPAFCAASRRPRCRCWSSGWSVWRATATRAMTAASTARRHAHSYARPKFVQPPFTSCSLAH